jgi:hypothetical protein
MRAALSVLLLVSTTMLAGCVEGGYTETGVAYDSGSNYYGNRYYGNRGFVRESRYEVYRVPDRSRYDRDDRYDRYDRRDRADRYDRNDRDDRRVQRAEADRRVGDRDNRRLLDAVNGQRDRREFDRRGEVCEYPCVR